MKLHHLLTFLVALLLAACGPFKVDAVPTPTPTPIPRPLPNCEPIYHNYPLCQMEMASPDQQHRWPAECHEEGMDRYCRILFPNGQKSTAYYFPLEWSPTNVYALVPMGGNHDSPPGGYELWNMLTATRTAVFDPVSVPVIGLNWAGWAPDGLSVFYLKHSPSESTLIVLTQVDVATGVESATRQCPDWLLAIRRRADAYRQWSLYCDNVRVPPDVPFILSFTAKTKTIGASENTILHWTSQGGTAAKLQQFVYSKPYTEVTVPVSGTLSVPIGSVPHDEIFFWLWLTNDRGQDDERTVWLPVK